MGFSHPPCLNSSLHTQTPSPTVQETPEITLEMRCGLQWDKKIGKQSPSSLAEMPAMGRKQALDPTQRALYISLSSLQCMPERKLGPWKLGFFQTVLLLCIPTTPEL